MPYDLFISYAHQGDNASREGVTALVARLHAELESDFRHRFNRHLEIFFDKEDIKDFDHWQVRCHRALRDSRFFIACLSRTYLRSDACRWEWEEWCRHELEHGLVGQGAASLWFVKLEDLDAPEDAALLRRWKGDLLQRFHVQCHEWRHDDHGNFLDTAARAELQQLTEHVAQRLRLLTLDRARGGNLPWPNANFVGREPKLASLRAGLLDAPEQSPAGIHGVGGMGKTALAQALAYKEADAFLGGCWLLRCEGRDRLLTVFRTLVTDLEIELTDKEKLDDAKAVRRVFDVLRARGPALFLLDNVDHPALLAQEQMKLLADQPWARVLYTTRLAPDDFTKAGAVIRPLDLDRLPENQAVDLIRRYQPGQVFASPEHGAASREIVRELSGLTLAVETAAVYLGQCDPRVTEPQYAVDVRSYLSKLREDLKTGGSEGVMSQLREVTATLRPTLARLDAPARTVLQIASLLAPDGVALPWVRAIAGQSHLELAAEAATGESDSWTQLIRGLIGMRLFQPTAEPRVVAIHRILQRVLQTELSEGISDTSWAIVKHASKRCDYLVKAWEDRDNRWEIEPLFDVFFEALNRHGSRAALVASNAAVVLTGLERLDEAEVLIRRALDEWAKEHEDTNYDTLRLRAVLATLLLQKGDSDEAEPLLTAVIAAQKRLFGVNDSATIYSMSNLVTVLVSKKDFTAAESLCRPVAEAKSRMLGPEHPSTLITIHNLAGILVDKKDCTEAQRVYEWLIDARRRVLGNSSPLTLGSIQEYARCLAEMGRLNDACKLHRSAFVGFDRVLGEDHPVTLSSLEQLASLLNKNGETTESQKFRREWETRTEKKLQKSKAPKSIQ